MLKKIMLGCLLLCGLSLISEAQNKKKTNAKSKTKAVTTKTSNKVAPKSKSTGTSAPTTFNKTESGVQYKFFVDNPGSKNIQENYVVKMHIKTLVADSVMFDTYKMNDNAPIEQAMSKQFIGAFWDGFTLLTEGDSAILRLPIDSAFKGAGALPPFAKSGDNVDWLIKVFTVSTPEEAEENRKKASKAQNDIDDKLIRNYVKEKGLKTLKTPSGIYYMIDKKGNGKHAVATDKVKVHYKGYKMDGSTFDSSYDRNAPIDFPLQGVIKGWTEGIPLFEEGGKGTLIIPSSLAYGPNPPPGSSITANEVLLFDVELLEINPKAQEAPETPSSAGDH